MSTAQVTLDKGTHIYTTGDGSSVPLCVSDVLRLAGICQPYPEIPSVLNFVEHARELGERVHEWCEYIDHGFSSVEALEGTELLPYVVAYQRFRDEHLPEWEHIEQSFVDGTLGCAGTPDRIGTIQRGKVRIPIMGDIKTSRKAESHWQLQLSAYQYLSRRLDCMPYVIHLASDASYKLRPFESDVETFLSAVRVSQWRMKNGVKLRERVREAVEV